MGPARCFLGDLFDHLALVVDDLRDRDGPVIGSAGHERRVGGDHVGQEHDISAKRHREVLVDGGRQPELAHEAGEVVHADVERDLHRRNVA